MGKASDEQESRRIYPDWLEKPYGQNAHDFAETLGRIHDRVEGYRREEQLKVKALAYCRSIAADFGGFQAGEK